jgi:hypothetical protein
LLGVAQKEEADDFVDLLGGVGGVPRQKKSNDFFENMDMI